MKFQNSNNIQGILKLQLLDNNGNVQKEIYDENTATLYAKTYIGNFGLTFDFITKDLTSEYGSLNNFIKSIHPLATDVKAGLISPSFSHDSGNKKYTVNINYTNSSPNNVNIKGLMSFNSNNIFTIYLLAEDLVIEPSNSLVGTYEISYDKSLNIANEDEEYTQTINENALALNTWNNKNLRDYKYKRVFLKTSEYFGFDSTDTNIQTSAIVGVSSNHIENKALDVATVDTEFVGEMFYEIMTNGGNGVSKARRYLKSSNQKIYTGNNPSTTGNMVIYTSDPITKEKVITEYGSTDGDILYTSSYKVDTATNSIVPLNNNYPVKPYKTELKSWNTSSPTSQDEDSFFGLHKKGRIIVYAYWDERPTLIIEHFRSIGQLDDILVRIGGTSLPILSTVAGTYTNYRTEFDTSSIPDVAGEGIVAIYIKDNGVSFDEDSIQYLETNMYTYIVNSTQMQLIDFEKGDITENYVSLYKFWNSNTSQIETSFTTSKLMDIDVIPDTNPDQMSNGSNNIYYSVKSSESNKIAGRLKNVSDIPTNEDIYPYHLHNNHIITLHNELITDLHDNSTDEGNNYVNQYYDSIRNRIYYMSNDNYMGYYDITNDEIYYNIPPETISNPILWVVQDQGTGDWETLFNHNVTISADIITDDLTSTDYDLNIPIGSLESIFNLDIDFDASNAYVAGEFISFPITDSEGIHTTDKLETWRLHSVTKFKENLEEESGLDKYQLYGLGNSNLLHSIEDSIDDSWTIEEVETNPTDLPIDNYVINFSDNHIAIEYQISRGINELQKYDSEIDYFYNNIVPIPKRINISGTEYIVDMRKVSLHDGYRTLPFSYCSDTPETLNNNHIRTEDLYRNFYFIDIAKDNDKYFRDYETKIVYIIIEKTTITDLLPLNLTAQNYSTQQNNNGDVIQINLPFSLPNTIKIEDEVPTSLEYTFVDEWGLETDYSNKILVKLPQLPAGTSTTDTQYTIAYGAVDLVPPHAKLNESSNTGIVYDNTRNSNINSSPLMDYSHTLISGQKFIVSHSQTQESVTHVVPSETTLTISNTGGVVATSPSTFFDFYHVFDDDNISSKFQTSGDFIGEFRNGYLCLRNGSIMTNDDIFTNDNLIYKIDLYSGSHGSINNSNYDKYNIVPMVNVGYLNNNSEWEIVDTDVFPSSHRKHETFVDLPTDRIYGSMTKHPETAKPYQISTEYNNHLNYLYNGGDWNDTFNRGSGNFGRKLKIMENTIFDNQFTSFKSISIYPSVKDVFIKEIDYTRELRIPYTSVWRNEVGFSSTNDYLWKADRNSYSKILRIVETDTISSGKDKVLLTSKNSQKPLWMLNNIKGYYLKSFITNEMYYNWLNGNSSQPSIKAYSFYMNASEFKSNYSGTNDVILHPQGYINPFMNDYSSLANKNLYIGYPFPPVSPEANIAPIIDIEWLREAFGDGFTLTGFDYEYLLDGTTSTTPSSTPETSVTNTILIKDVIFGTRSGNPYPTFTNDGFSILEEDITSNSLPNQNRKSFIYLPYEDNTNPPIFYSLGLGGKWTTKNVFGSDDERLNYWLFSYNQSYLESYFNSNTVKFSYALEGKSTILCKKDGITNQNWSTWQYEYPRPVPGMLILNNYPTGDFNKLYTIDPDTPYSPAETINEYGIYTPNVDLITEVQRQTSDLYFSNPLNIQKIDYIGGINIADMVQYPKIADYDHDDLIDNINYYIVIKIEDTVSPATTYHTINDKWEIVDVTTEVNTNDLDSIRTTHSSLADIKDLEQLNDFFSDKKTGDFEISFGVFFYTSTTLTTSLIYQFYGMDVYVELNDATAYKEINWAFYDPTNDTVTDTSSASTNTVILEPTIASWIIIEEDGIAESQPSNSLNFDTTRDFTYPLPLDILLSGGWISG